MKEKNKKVKKKKSHRIRHKFLYWLLRPLVRLFLAIKFGYKCKKAKNLPDKYIVVSNHTTDYDPLLVSASFRRQMYFVASEHITRWKTAYKLINYIFEPIIRYKATTATTTVMEMLRKVRAGDSVCIFAEGVRSWNGENSPISLSTAKMIKSAGCGLVTYRITGGYLVSPIWAENGCRRGYLRGEPVNVYTAEDLAQMSAEEVLEVIVRDTYENAYATQDKLHKKYKGKKLAEGIENLIFKCEHCGESDTITSHDNIVGCSKCGHAFRYNEYGYLEGCKFNNLLEYSNWQEDRVLEDVKSNTTYEADNAILSAIALDHSKRQVAEGKLVFNRETLRCGDFEVSTQDITHMAVFGRRGLVFSAGNDYYEIRPDKRFSAWKFLSYYNAYYRLNKSKSDNKLYSSESNK